MDTSEAKLTVAAAGLLRGDLSDLVSDGRATVIDDALRDAIKRPDIVVAADAVRAVVADDPGLGARLATYERDLRAGGIQSPRHRGGLAVQLSPPGDPVPLPSRVWTCPEEPPSHFRRKQRSPNSDMGKCPDHGVRLVPESGEC